MAGAAAPAHGSQVSMPGCPARPRRVGVGSALEAPLATAPCLQDPRPTRARNEFDGATEFGRPLPKPESGKVFLPRRVLDDDPRRAAQLVGVARHNDTTPHPFVAEYVRLLPSGLQSALLQRADDVALQLQLAQLRLASR